MPELPEVETIKRGLEQLIIRMEIDKVDVRLAKMVHGNPDSVTGGTIIRVNRRGKGLLIDLDNGYSLAIHVKMTGQLIFRGFGAVKNFHPTVTAPSDLPNKYTHVIFSLRTKNEEQRAKLFYNDIRQFGWIKIVKTVEAENLPFFSALGPEPLSSLTFEHFNTILLRSRSPIKQVLMDQSRMAGIGNIYANDALFLAGIHPLRPANNLTEDESRKLFAAVESVLREGIRSGGASEENFVNAIGEKGFYQEKFLVYKQTGKPCKNCGTPIERIVLGGRGTFLCSVCQV